MSNTYLLTLTGMITAVLFSFLLLGMPAQSAQDTVSVQKVRELESQVEALRAEIENQQDYMSWTIFGERTAYAALLTVIGALFLFLSYTSIRWRIEHTEKEMRKEIEDVNSFLENYVEESKNEIKNYIDGNIDVVSGKINENSTSMKSMKENMFLRLSEVYDGVSSLRSFVRDGEIISLSPVLYKLKSVRMKMEIDNEYPEKELDIRVLGMLLNSTGDDFKSLDKDYDESNRIIKDIKQIANEEDKSNYDKIKSRLQDIYEKHKIQNE